MLALSAFGMGVFLNPGLLDTVMTMSPEELRVASLALVGGLSSLLGLHLVSSIGGPDMPVVITVLNR